MRRSWIVPGEGLVGAQGLGCGAGCELHGEGADPTRLDVRRDQQFLARARAVAIGMNSNWA